MRLGKIGKAALVQVLLFLGTEAWQAMQPSPSSSILSRKKNPSKNQITKSFAGAILSAALILGPPTAAWASETAAHITLQRLPPTSIDVSIKDLPVVGKLLSGTYSKVPESIQVAAPSIVIESPSDKAKAIQDILKNGHLEFDVSGTIDTHLDVDVAADRAGVMTVRIASPLIPKLPFKNLASYSTQASPTGGKESPWNMVTNMGSGDTYYYNEKTGLTQYERPSKF